MRDTTTLNQLFTRGMRMATATLLFNHVTKGQIKTRLVGIYSRQFIKLYQAIELSSKLRENSYVFRLIFSVFYV